MENVNENKLSIKNLLFSKAIPCYVIPVPTGGHKLFSCTDCGDKFILESSYEDHVDRKSVQISYVCRYCGESKVFYNRCNLLSHIRSHAYKTATINVTDLKIEPLPISFYNMTLLSTNSESTTQKPQAANILKNIRKKSNILCFECKKDITDTGVIYKDRAKHYMEYTNKVHTCPICMFTLPTTCGLAAHLRIHLTHPPYYCPECGIHLPNKSVLMYPFNHDCEGFKMMRATARLKCPVPKCPLFHPTEYREHMKQKHLKKVFKCPFCFVACFSEPIMVKHLKSHKLEGKASIFFQCEMCPGRLVLQNQIDNHIKCHVNNTKKYPCWICGYILKDAPSVLGHHMDKHDLSSRVINENETILRDLLEPYKPKRVYRVVKRCDQCKRSFTYKCKFEQIGMLPNECPYKLCSNGLEEAERNLSEPTTETQITCHICKNKMSENWQDVKKHFALHHKSYRCLDAKIVATKLDIAKITKHKAKRLKQSRNIRMLTKKKRRNIANTFTTGDIQLSTISLNDNQFVCSKCKFECETKQQLETHMITHRDPCMAYQCMECGQCFVVKPSFSTHLLLEHRISDVQDYINKKSCYNENALLKHQYGSVSNEPLRENQCTICREQFDSSDDLEKHFRVHGMAFLMKNNSNKNTSP